MPLTNQITEITLTVRTYFWVTIKNMCTMDGPKINRTRKRRNFKINKVYSISNMSKWKRKKEEKKETLKKKLMKCKKTYVKHIKLSTLLHNIRIREVK